MLQRALDHIEATLAEDIGPGAIAATTGCSLRNLQFLFRREFDATLTDYIRRRRLTLARSRLLAANEGDSVTSVALASGFSHLSEFARHYFNAFGERPSQTLAAARRR